MTSNTFFKIIFNTALGVILIIIWSHFVNLGEIFLSLSRVNLLSLMPVFLFMFISPLARAIRLQIFLKEVKKIRLLDLIFLNGVAMMLNFFIPIRAGEIAKGVYLHTNYDLNMGKAVIWVFLDRLLDFLVVLLLTTFLLAVTPTSLGITIIIIITIILILALVLTWLAVFKSDFTRKIAIFLSYLLIEKHIKIYFSRFSTFILNSFSVLRRSPKDLSLMVLITIFAYGADASVWYFTFISLGFHQDFLKMYLGQLLSALTYLIPAAPGYIGSAEASGLLILSGIFKIENNLSSAMIVLFHITSAVFLLVFGLVSVYNLKMNMSLILKKTLKRGN